MIKIKNYLISRLKIMLILLSVVGFSFNIYADTIYLKDGNIIKNVKNIEEKDGIVYFVIEGWESDVRSYREGYIDRIEKAPIKKKKASSGVVYSSAGYDFRKTKWGMSQDDVIAAEKADPEKGETGIFEFLAYQTRVLDKDVYLGYYFFNNKLIMARYILAEKHTNKNDFISDYLDFQEILKGKYGQPQSDKIIWKNERYRNKPTRYGMALSLGHLAYSSDWKTPSTNIECSMAGENFEIKCTVLFSTTNQTLLRPLKKEWDKDRLDDF
jgi:hypothetical protein